MRRNKKFWLPYNLHRKFNMSVSSGSLATSVEISVYIILTSAILLLFTFYKINLHKSYIIPHKLSKLSTRAAVSLPFKTWHCCHICIIDNKLKSTNIHTGIIFLLNFIKIFQFRTGTSTVGMRM